MGFNAISSFKIKYCPCSSLYFSLPLSVSLSIFSLSLSLSLAHTHTHTFHMDRNSLWRKIFFILFLTLFYFKLIYILCIQYYIFFTIYIKDNTLIIIWPFISIHLQAHKFLGGNETIVSQLVSQPLSVHVHHRNINIENITTSCFNVSSQTI